MCGYSPECPSTPTPSPVQEAGIRFFLAFFFHGWVGLSRTRDHELEAQPVFREQEVNAGTEVEMGPVSPFTRPVLLLYVGCVLCAV